MIFSRLLSRHHFFKFSLLVIDLNCERWHHLEKSFFCLAFIDLSNNSNFLPATGKKSTSPRLTNIQRIKKTIPGPKRNLSGGALFDYEMNPEYSLDSKRLKREISETVSEVYTGVDLTIVLSKMDSISKNH